MPAIRRFLLAAACFLLVRETSALAQPAEVDWSLGGIHDITELDLADLLKTPVVESAARRKQSLDEAPGALEVFESDEIATAGLTSLAAVLRRVPGVFVTEINANRFDVGMRGVHALANNRVLVLVNGRRLAEFDRGSPSWQLLPVHVGEIERIEVLRGPGTTIYGADAISGVINIVTKTPLDNLGVHASFAAGETWLPDVDGDLHGDHIQNLGNGFATYALADKERKLGASLTAGWNHVPDWMPADGTSIQKNGDFGYHLASTVDWRPDARTSLSVDARAILGEGSRAFDTLYDKRLYHYGSEQSLTLAFRRDEFLVPNVSLTVNGDVRHSIESTTVATPRNYLEPTSANNPADFFVKVKPWNYRGHLLAQVDAAVFQGRSLFSLAGESSYQTTQDFYASSSSQVYYALVAQNETRFGHRPEFLLNLGIRAEQANLLVEGRGESKYANVSPRLSLIARLSDNHSIRMLAGSAYRTPALWEVTDLATGNAVPFFIKRNTLSLRPEEVNSAEVGYRGRPMRWLRVDLTGYLQQLKNQIGIEREQIPFVYENGEQRTYAGVELGLKIRPTAVASGRFAYALTQPWNGSASQVHDFPTHLLQVGSDLHFGDFRFNLDFSYASAISSRLLMLTTSGPTVLSSTGSRQLLLNARLARQLLHGKAELFLCGTNLLAPLRSRDALTQYPYSAADPIGLVVLTGIALHDTEPGGHGL
jgi:outer membrane receptor protein involved in Fe transport